MIKHIVLLIALSVAAVFLKHELAIALHVLLMIHKQLVNGLGIIFSTDAIGEMLQSVLALLLFPVVIGVIISFIHLMTRHAHFPHTMTVIWVCWSVLLVAILCEDAHVGSKSMLKSALTPKSLPTMPSPNKPDAPSLPRIPDAPPVPHVPVIPHSNLQQMPPSSVNPNPPVNHFVEPPAEGAMT